MNTLSKYTCIKYPSNILKLMESSCNIHRGVKNSKNCTGTTDTSINRIVLEITQTQREYI